MTTARIGNCSPRSPQDRCALLNDLYRSYYDLVSGKRVSHIQTNDFRQVDRQQVEAKELIRAYNQLWDLDPTNTCGLPRLSEGPTARRGGPAYFGC